jgi:hypothetical protein
MKAKDRELTQEMARVLAPNHPRIWPRIAGLLYRATWADSRKDREMAAETVVDIIRGAVGQRA